MPVVDYDKYCQMLEHARDNHFAYPAFNITSMSTVNAVLAGLAESQSDGIIQVSTGGAEFASGSVKSMVKGAIALAEYTRFIAQDFDVNIALHTDHCVKEKLATYLEPLVEETERRRAKGLPNLFNSHMFDGSTVPLKENLEIAEKLLERCAKSEIILEVEAGVVGGEEDGHDNSGVANEQLYTTTEEMLAVYESLNKRGKFMLAATFGNVHGVYKPGNVKLRPQVLKDGQDAVFSKYNDTMYLVFHGGSGSDLSDIHATLDYGVIKMNIDTDTQYAYTRPIVDHVMKNYDGVLKVDHEVGNKKTYDPRSYLKKAEASMKERVVQACRDLRSHGQTLQ